MSMLSYRTKRLLRMSRAGQTPIQLLRPLYRPRYLAALESVWRMSDRKPLTCVLPDALFPGVAELLRGTGHRSWRAIACHQVAAAADAAFDCIVLLPGMVQELPAATARRVLAEWTVVHDLDGVVVLTDPSRGEPGATGATEGLALCRSNFAELEDLARHGMTIEGFAGTTIRCRYSVFDLAAVKEVNHAYFRRMEILPTDVIVDVGAHIGSFAVPCGKLSRDGTVFAFEPSPANFKMLAENVAANCPGKVKLFQQAIFKHRCQLSFNLDPQNSANNSLFKKHEGEHAVKVECLGLADILQVVGGPIDWFKIDAEGAEYDFLFGQGQLLRDRVRQLVIEAHQTGPYDGRDMARFLEETGYTVECDGPANALTVIARRK